jgi:hypothetical protein
VHCANLGFGVELGASFEMVFAQSVHKILILGCPVDDMILDFRYRRHCRYFFATTTRSSFSTALRFLGAAGTWAGTWRTADIINRGLHVASVAMP